MPATESNVLWVESEKDGDLANAVNADMDQEIGGYVFRLVKKAETPQEAYDYFAKHGAGIDLILMDIVWKDEGFATDGIELARGLVAIHNCAVVYLTGKLTYVDELVSRIDKRPASVIVPKGFEPRELALRMADVMGTFERETADPIRRQALSYLRRFMDWGEAEALSKLQSLSGKSGTKLLRIAEQIVRIGKAIEGCPELQELREMFNQS